MSLPSVEAWLLVIFPFRYPKRVVDFVPVERLHLCGGSCGHDCVRAVSFSGTEATYGELRWNNWNMSGHIRKYIFFFFFFFFFFYQLFGDFQLSHFWKIEMKWNTVRKSINCMVVCYGLVTFIVYLILFGILYIKLTTYQFWDKHQPENVITWESPPAMSPIWKTPVIGCYRHNTTATQNCSVEAQRQWIMPALFSSHGGTWVNFVKENRVKTGKTNKWQLKLPRFCMFLYAFKRQQKQVPVFGHTSKSMWPMFCLPIFTNVILLEPISGWTSRLKLSGDFSSGYSGTLDLKCVDNVTSAPW